MNRELIEEIKDGVFLYIRDELTNQAPEDIFYCVSRYKLNSNNLHSRIVDVICDYVFDIEFMKEEYTINDIIGFLTSEFDLGENIIDIINYASNVVDKERVRMGLIASAEKIFRETIIENLQDIEDFPVVRALYDKVEEEGYKEKQKAKDKQNKEWGVPTDDELFNGEDNEWGDW